MSEMDWRDEAALKAMTMIGAYGTQVTYVGAGEQTSPFAYTAGLTAIGEPELMLILPAAPETLQGILNDLSRRVLEDGVRLQPGDRLGDVLAGPYDVVICGPVPDEAMHADTTGYFPGIARAVYGDRVRVFQVVVPDAAGRFPWQDGYSMPQPLIAPAPAGAA